MIDADAIRLALGRGDCLVAYDLAQQALEADPDDLRARYFAVLALARAGSLDRAEERLTAFGFDGPVAEAVEPALAEDIGALRARLAKDAALAASGEERAARARVAAERYEATYRALGRPFACINAASMWLLAGDRQRSAQLAREALELVLPRSSRDYWDLATAAEAHLLLGDLEAARDALAVGAALGPDAGDRATTRRQLLILAAALGVHAGFLDALPVDAVIHFTGHMVARRNGAARLGPEDESRVAAQVASWLEERAVGFGYGALACGADIVIAEALLARGAELHVVLPFARDAFVATSVAPAGDEWVQRFDDCMASATSVTFVTEHHYPHDSPVLYQHGAQVAMGRAVLRAAYLSTDVVQLAVWDGVECTGAGTGADVAAWRASGRATHVVSVAALGAAPAAPEPEDGQSVRALLFADVRGFSRLDEMQVPAFLEHVMGAFAAVIDGCGDAVVSRNTWGDGLYLVFADVLAAARCALALQEAMQAIDLPAAGLPDTLALRIGGHAGPVFERMDPVTRRPGFYGVEVTRTARIEPGTPAGDVYVTDAFAALVALCDHGELACHYVGPVPTAKAFGVLPLYALRRAVPLAG